MPTNPGADPFDFLSSGTELAERIRAHDWSATPLGSPQSWPRSLKTALRIMLDSRYQMFVWWGRELTKFYNDAYISVLGGRHPWALGQPASHVWAEIWDTLGPQTEQVMTEGRATWNEERPLVMERNGYPEEVFFTFSYSPIADDEGKVGGVFCACSEDTRRVLGERRLRALKDLGGESGGAEDASVAARRLLTVLDNHRHDVPFAALYRSDGNGDLILAGMTTALFEAKTRLPERLSPATSAPWPWLEVVASGESRLVGNVEAHLGAIASGPWPDPVRQAYLVPFKGGGQTPLGVVALGLSTHRPFDTDYRNFCELIADRIASTLAAAQAYEAERRRAEALAELDRAKTTFFSNVSHEFRTPLTLMLGPAEDLLAREDLPAAARGRLETLHRNGLRLQKLVNSLLEFSRIEAGRVQAHYEAVDLAALTRDLASTFRSAIERAGLSFELDIQALPESVYVDREMWEKIVLNLLSNAFKFTLSGAIRVRLLALRTQCLLSVEDTGTGVPELEVPRLFDRFYRVESTHGRTHEGSGIGLALVQELVKLNGGTITAASRLGHGSTFSVAIPFGNAHLPEERIGNSDTRSSIGIGAQAFVQEALRWLPDSQGDSGTRRPIEPAADHRFRATFGARLVVADDNADMRDYLRALLAPYYQVECTGDGEAALEAVRRQRPALLISDVMMPRLDGFALMRILRADGVLKDLPILLLSARAGEESRLEGLDSGADDYLVKPFSARELLVRVGALLELTRMRRESEERFRAFVGATSDVIYRMSPDWSEMWLLDGRNFIRDTTNATRGWLETYIAPEDQSNVMAAVREAIRTKSNFQLEHRVRRVDGSYGWTFSRAIPLKDAAGNIIEWFGAAADVTERKRSEELAAGQRRILEKVATGTALNETLDELMHLLESQEPGVRCALLIVNEEGTHFLRGSGPSLPEEYHGALDGTAIAPPYIGCCGEAAHRSEAITIADVAADTRYAPRWRELLSACGIQAAHSTPVRGTRGRVLGSLAIYYDRPRESHPANPQLIEIGTHLAAIAIERDRVGSALRHSREQLQAIVNDSPNGIYLVDEDMHICEVNPIARSVFGEMPDLIGRDLDEVMHILWSKHYADELVAIFRQTLETGEPYYAPERIEERLDRGVIEFYEWQVHRVPMPNGRHGVVCYFRDISTQVHARRALEEADRQKDEFLAMLAHELRNPLAPISNASELLARTVATTDARTGAAVAVIQRQVAQLTRLVDDLLDISRITQGRIQLEKRSVELSTVVTQALETVDPMLRAKHHRVSISADYKPVFVLGDFTRLVQCVGNILTNAAKYTDPHGEIRVQTRTDGESAVIEVTDNGAGISSQLLPHVFDLFVQSARTLDRAQGGLGIGLALVKRLVQMHGGKVSARSTGEGQGATFEIRLPRVAAISSSPEQRGQETDTQRRRVLIVDDNVDAAHSLAQLLRLEGHEVEVAYAAKEALERLSSSKPEVALLDLGLPKMDGYELAGRIRAMPVHANIRLVAVSGYGLADDRARARLAGFDDHLVKPVELAALERTMRGSDSQ